MEKIYQIKVHEINKEEYISFCSSESCSVVDLLLSFDNISLRQTFASVPLKLLAHNRNSLKDRAYYFLSILIGKVL